MLKPFLLMVFGCAFAFATAAERIDLLTPSSNASDGGCGGDWYKLGDGKNTECSDGGMLRINGCNGGTGRKEFPSPKNWDGTGGYKQTYPDWYVVIEAKTSADNVKIGFGGGCCETRSFDSYNSGVVPNSEDYGYVILGQLSQIWGKNENTFQLFSLNSTICIKSVFLTDVPPTMVEKPKNVSATSASYSQVDLTWNTAQNAVKYDVYRAQSNDCNSASYTKVTQVTSTSFSNTGLTANTKYCYYVVAVASDGTESSPSQKVSVTTPLKPSSVTDLKAVANDHKSISLSWKDNSMTSSTVYDIYRSKASDGTYEKVGTVTGNTNFTDNDGLKPETTYYYKIQVSDGGQSAVSSIVNATTLEITSYVTVTVNPLPICDITGVASLCPKTESTYSVANVSGYTYKWTISGNATIVGASDQYQVKIKTGNSCGNFTLEVSVESDKGCTNSCNKTVSVADSEKPTITGTIAETNINGCTKDDAPAAVTSIAALEALGVAVSDNCTIDEDLRLSHSDNVSGTCPIVVTRTYTVKDLCDNTQTVTHIIKIQSTTKPVISTTATNENLGCNPASIPTPTFTVTDVCNASASPTATQTTTNVGCEYTRTWKANYKNACNLAADEVVVVYTWTQTTTPTIVAKVMGGNLGCNPAIIPSLTDADFTVNDACNASAKASISSDEIVENGCSRSQTWRANYTNECGQKATEVTITYTWKQDTEKPVINTIATSKDLGCNPTVTPPTFTVTDNCDNDLKVDVQTTGATNTGCNYTQTWTANVTDACGNVAETKTITYTWKQDTEKPVISTTATSDDLGCNPIVTAPTFMVTDNCDDDLIATVTDSGVSNTGCNYTQTWTANVTDKCGNVADTKIITYTWKQDTEKPIISTTETSKDLGCNPTVTAPTFTVTDNCDNDLIATVTTDGPTNTGCNYTQTWTANVTDACGNVAETKTITYTWKQDTEKPVISTTATSKDLGCNPTVTAPTFTVTDNCDDDLIATVMTDGPTNTGCKYTQTWTANVTDECGNVADTKTITYTWKQDTEKPFISTTATSGELGCNPTVTAPTFMVTDNCDDDLIATVTTDGPTNTGCNYTQTWTANVTDACGNVAETKTITYTWREMTTPTLVANVVGEDLGCNPTKIPSLTDADFTVNDACNPSAKATISSDEIVENGCSRSQTWRANYKNECNQSAPEVTITYTWIDDAVKPTIGDIETSVTLSSTNCTFVVPDFKSIVMAVATDGCSELTYSQNAASGTTATNGQIVKVTVTDACNNSESKDITLVVPEKPTIVSSNIACDEDLLTYHADVTVTYATATADVTTTAGTLTKDGTDDKLYHITKIAKGTNITVTITDANGCVETVNITAPDCNCPTIAAPTADNIEYCEGSAIPAFSATATLGADEVLIWLNSENTELQRGTELTYTPESAGTYHIYVKNTITNCESQKTTITATENPKPTVTLTGDEICQNEDGTAKITLSPTVTGGTPSYTYKWNDETTEATKEVTTSGKFSVTVTDSKGCSVTSGEVDATINPLPEVTIDGNSSACPSTDIALKANVTSGTMPFTYEWTNATGTTADVVATTPSVCDTKTVKVVVTDSKQCKADATKTIEAKDEENPVIGTIADITLTSTDCTFSVPDLKDATKAVTTDNCTSTDNLTYTQDKAAETVITETTTVTVTMEDVCGNKGTQTIKLIVPEKPTIVSSNIACDEDLLTYHADVTVTYATETANVVTTAGTLTKDGTDDKLYHITKIAKGTNITVTITDANGCVETVNITAPDCNCPTIVAPTADNIEYCEGSAIPSFSATATLGADEVLIWLDSENTELQRGTELTFTPEEAGTYYIYVKNTITNCESQKTTITATENPKPTVTLTGDEICQNEDGTAKITLSPTVTGGTPSYTYKWNDDTTEATKEVTTSGKFSVTVTDSKGCSATSGEVDATINPLPEVTIDGNSSACPSTDIALTANVTSGTIPFTYEWTNATGTTADVVATTPSVCDTKTVKVVVTDSKQCKAGATKTIEAKDEENPVIGTIADITLTSTDCTFSVPDLKDATKAVTTDNCTSIDNLTYTQDKAAGTVITETTTVTVTMEDVCGNKGTQTIKLIVPEKPTIVSSNIACDEDLLTYHADVTVTYATATADVTTTAGTLTKDGTDDKLYHITKIAKGTNITVTITDANGCVEMVNITAPDCNCPTITAPTADNIEYCEGSAIPAFSATATLGTDEVLIWLDSENTELQRGTELTYTPEEAGTYYIYVKNTITNCESQKTTITATENPKPTVTLTGDEICQNEEGTAKITLSPTVTGGTPSYTYKWNDETTEATKEVTTSGKFSVTVTDSKGCSATSGEVDATINPLPTLSVTNTDQTICDSESAISAIQISSENAELTVENLPLGLTFDETAKTITGKPAVGTYNDIVVKATNDCETKTETVKIVVKAMPTLSVTNTDQTICDSETAIATIQITSENAELTVENLPSGLTFDETAKTITGKPAVGTYDNIIVKAKNDCETKTETIKIVVNALPDVAITTSVACENTDAVLTATAGLQSYKWEKVGGVELTESSNVLTIPNVSLSENGDEYKVTVTDENGCVNTATKAIEVKSCTDLTLTKTATETVCEEGTITYTLKLKNNAAEAATDIHVKDLIPTEVENLSITATDNVYEWIVTSLGGGEDIEFSFTATAKDGQTSATNKAYIAYANGGIIENASFDAVTEDTQKAQATTTILAKATLTVTNETQTLCVGESIDDIQITSNVEVTIDDLPTGLNFDKVTGKITGTPSAGDYYFVINAENTCNLEQKLVHIEVNQLPEIEIQTNPVCEGGDAVLTATEGFTSYQWYLEDAELTGETTNVLTISDVKFADNGKEYTVKVVDAKSCKNTQTKGIIVNQYPSVADKSISVCSGAPTGDIDLSVGIDGATYAWQLKGVPSETVSGYTTSGVGSIIPSQNITTTLLDSSDTLTYEIFVDNEGCSATYNYSVIVRPQPVLNAAATPSVVCADESFVLEARANTAARYVWYEADNTTKELVSEIGSTASVSVLKIDLDDKTVEKREDGWFKDYRIVAHLLLHDDEGNVIFEGCPVEKILSVHRLDTFECKNKPNLGRDTTFCVGQVYHLNAGDEIKSPETLTWYKDGVLMKDKDGNDLHGVEIDVTEPGIYVVHNILTDPTNLINNGDFNIAGSGGTFYSDYEQSQKNLYPEGVYAILNNPRASHGNFDDCFDHTSGTRAGKMMVVNGSPEENAKVWCQPISVLPHTDYEFSAWFSSVNPVNGANLVFSIGHNQLLDDPIILPSPAEDDPDKEKKFDEYCCHWTQFSTVWNSTTYTNVDVCIENKNIIRHGNDFAIDDIYFARVYDITDTVVIDFQDVKVEVNDVLPYCKEDGKEVELTANVTTSTSKSVNDVKIKGYEWSTGETTQKITVVPQLGENEYIVSVTTDDYQACVARDTAIIEVYDLPVISMVGDTICQTVDNDAEIILAPAVTKGTPDYKYYWNGATTEGENTYKVTGTGEKQTSLKVEDVHGCSADTTVNTKINALPEVSIATTKVCVGEEATLTASATGVPTLEYLWNDDDASTTTSIVIDTDDETLRTREFTVEVTDGNGCKNTASKVPESEICTELKLTKTASNPVCDGENTTFTLKVSNNSPSPATDVQVTDVLPTGMTFVSSSVGTYDETTGVWNIGTMASKGSEELQIIVKGKGSKTNYTNKAYVSSVNGDVYSSYDEATVKAEADATIYPLPTLSFTSDSLCTNDEANTPTVILNAVTNATIYEWRNASDEVISDAVSYNAIADGKYTLKVTDANGCFISRDTTVVMPQKPTVNVEDDEVCQTLAGDASITLVPTVIGGNPEYIYNWDGTTDTKDLKVTESGTHTIVVTDALGCRATDDATATINPLPDMTIDGEASVCPTSENNTYSVENKTGYTYAWSIDGDAEIIGEMDKNSVSVTAKDKCGEFTLTVVVKTDKTCEKTFTKTVAVVDTEKPSIIGTIETTVLEKCTIDDLPTAETSIEGLETLGVIISDNCTPKDKLILSSADETSGTCPIVTVRTYTVTDLCGNTQTITHRIEINDTTKPDVTEIETQNAVSEGDCKFSVPDFVAITRQNASDNCTAKEDLTITQNPAAGEQITEDTDVKVSVVDACGNDSTITVKVVVPTTIKVSLNTPEVICQNITGDATRTLEATVESGTEPYKYSWDGGEDTTDNIKSFGITENGEHQVVVTDKDGCQASAKATTTINPLPTLSFTSDSLCTNDEANTPTVVVNAVTNANTYEWRNASDEVISDAVSYNAIADGKYTLKVTDANGCFISRDTAVVMPQKPTVNVEDDEVCQTLAGDASITLVPTVIGGNPEYTYNWDGTTDSKDLKVTESGAHTVVVTDALGCRATDDATATINPLPDMTIDGEASVCPTSENNTYSVENKIGYTYAWSIDGDAEIIGEMGKNSISVTAKDKCGEFTLTVIVKTDKTCEKSFTKTVAVVDAEKPSITGTIETTILEKCTIDDLPTAETSIEGLETLGVTVTDNCTPKEKLTLSSADETSGTCPIVTVRTYTVTDLCGNTQTVTHRIEINDTTNPVIASLDDHNADSKGNCRFEVPDLISEVRANSTDNCTANADLVITQSPEAGTQIFADTEVQISVTDACQNESTTTVNVLVPSVVNVKLNSPDAICNNTDGTATIELVATVENGNTPYKYSWDNAEPVENESTKSFGFAENGEHKVVVTDADGCQAEDVATITIYPLPTLSFTSDSLCTNDEANTPTVVVNAVTNANTYEWRNTSDEVISDAVSYNAIADGKYTLKVTDANGCFISRDTTVVMPQKPTVNVEDDEVCQTLAGDASITLVPTVIGGNPEYTYNWDGTTDTKDLTVTESGTHTIVVTDALGCRATDDATATINPLPDMTIDGEASVCPTSENNTYSAENKTGYTYAWSIDGDAEIVGEMDKNSVSVTAKDKCGEFTLTVVVKTDKTCEKSFTKTVAVVDTEKPSITGTIETTILEKCTIDDLPAAETSIDGLETLGVIISDNCTPKEKLMLSSADETSGTCPIVTIRTYTVTDLCGNTQTVMHHIEINDTTKPVIVPLDEHNADSKGNCRFEVPDLISEVRANSTDNCTAQADLFITQSPVAGTQITENTEVQISVKDACQNESTTTVNILVPKMISVELNTPAPICENLTGDATVQLVATAHDGRPQFTYYWDDATAGIADNTYNATNGTHKVRVVDVDGCDATAETLVTIYPLPTISFTSDSLCTNDVANTPTVVLNAVTNANIYEWRNANETIVSSEVSYNATADGKYTLTVTDNHGCKFTRDTTIVMPQKPTVKVDDKEMCQTPAGDAVITLKAEVTGIHPDYQYIWDKNSAFNNSELEVREIRTTSHSVEITDAIGCRAEITATATIHPLSELMVNSTETQKICLNESIKNISIEWKESSIKVENLPNGVTFNESTGIISGSPTNSGTWNITITATNDNECDVLTESVTIVVYPLPELVVTPTEKQEFCLGESIKNISLEWKESSIKVENLPDGVIFNEVTGIISGKPEMSGNWNILITATNPNQCGVLTETVNIVVNPLPEVQVPEQSICIGETTELVPNGTFASYLWSNGATTKTISVSPEKTTQYSLIVKNEFGCQQMALTYVNVNPLPEFTLKVTDTDCATPTGKIEFAYVSIDDYSFTVNGQRGLALENLGEGDYIITVIDNKTGCESKPQTAHIYVQNVPVLTLMTSPTATLTCDYEEIEIIAFPDGGEAPYSFSMDNVNYQKSDEFIVTTPGNKTIYVKDAKGCTSFNTIMIDEDKLPPVLHLIASPEHLDCLTPSSHLTLEIEEPISGIRSVIWTDNSSLSTRERDVTKGGEYSVTVTANNGCPSSTATVVVTEDRTEPVATIKASASSFTCNVDKITLTAESSVAGSTYLWNNGSTSESIEVTEEGEYSVMVTAPSGCTDEAVIRLHRETVPVVSLLTSPSATLTCDHPEITISAYADGGVAPYTYSMDGINFQSSNEFTVTTPGNKTIYVKDAKGCTSFNTILIDEDKLPPVLHLTASPEHLDCLTPSSHLTLEIEEPISGIRSVIWTDNSSLSTRERDVTKGGEYSVTVTANNGCPSSTATVVVTEDRTEPVATIKASASSFTCNVDKITLTAESSVAGSTYLWNNGSTSESIEVTEEGEYSVMVTAPSGCTDEAIIHLHRETVPVVSLLTSPSATLTCDHPEITISAYADGGVAPYTYSMDGINFQSSNEFTVTTPGNKTIYVKDAKGCTSFNTILIDEDKEKIIFTPQPLLPVCEGEAVNISQPAEKGYLYHYHDADKHLINDAQIAVAGTYYVSKYNTHNNCESELMPVEVQIISKPSLVFEIAQPQCYSDNGKLIVPSSNLTYELNGVPNADINNIEPGRYTVRAVSPEGCRSDAQIINIIKSSELPAFSAVITHPVCVGDLGAIRLVKDKTYSYTINGVENGQLTDLPAGDYEIKVSTPSGCTSDGRIITVNKSKVPQPTFTLKVTQPACDKLGRIDVEKDALNKVILNGMPDAELTDLVPGTYEVKVVTPEGCLSEPQTVEIVEGDGKFHAPVAHDYIACATEGEIELNSLVDEADGTLRWYRSLNGTIPTSFTSFRADAVQHSTYYVSQTDANGCESDRVRVNIQVLENVDFTLPTDTIVCAGQVVTIKLANKPVDATTVWSDTPSKISVSNSAIKIMPTTSETISATVSNGYCQTTKSINVVVADAEVVMPSDTVLCGPNSLQLSASGADTYQWTSTNFISTDATLNMYIEETTRFVLKTTVGNCVSQKSILVTVAPVPVIDNVVSYNGGRASVVATNGTEPYRYSIDGEVWQETNILTDLVDGEHYQVELIDANNCKSSMSFVYENRELTIPIYFSPNDDGVNDRWELGGIEKFPGIEIYIYDRFSKLLLKYKGNDWRGWDGYYLGKLMPSTDYWYLIIIPDGEDITGHFTLLNHD